MSDDPAIVEGDIEEEHPKLDIKSTRQDLHVDGNPDCEHDFSQWRILNEVEEETGDDREVVRATLRIDSDCAYCPARAGVVILTRIYGPPL